MKVYALLRCPLGEEFETFCVSTDVAQIYDSLCEAVKSDEDCQNCDADTFRKKLREWKLEIWQNGELADDACGLDAAKLLGKEIGDFLNFIKKVIDE